MRLLILAMRQGGGCSSGGLTSALLPCIPHEVQRKQDIGPATSQTSGRVPAQVYVDADQWERFATVAQAQNRSRSAQVRELISRDIAEHDERVAA